MSSVKDPLDKPGKPNPEVKRPSKPVNVAQTGTVAGRPRAQVAYEGDDEFSVMSTAESRRRKPAVDLDPPDPVDPGAKPPEQSAESDDPNKGTRWHFVRKIFGF